MIIIVLAQPALAQSAEPSVQELQKEVRQRDALIQNLARRVAILEKQANKRSSTSASARQAVTSPIAVAPASGSLPAKNVSFGPQQTAQAPATPTSPPAATAPSEAARPVAPGQFEVSPEAAERALERTLVATGNLVVPSGFAEIEPLFSYTRRENSVQVLFNVNRNELQPAMPLTSGQSRLSSTLTALRRQDPLVFIATAGYSRAFEANGINPGNQFNFVTGAFLATSPETTLRTVLSQNFVQDITVHGVTIPGSNTAQPILIFGASSILGRGILVDLQVGIGLSNAAPKYNVILSSTYRFGVPGL